LRATSLWLSLAILPLAGCVPVRPAPGARAPAAATPPAGSSAGTDGEATAGATKADAAGGLDPKREEFETQVRPILEKRCSPCHFPGGKMYDRLPFDRPGTIRVLGTALFTRIHDPEDRATISAFLGVPNEGLPEPP
jgi:hypothetical protein